MTKELSQMLQEFQHKLSVHLDYDSTDFSGDYQPANEVNHAIQKALDENEDPE